MRSILSLSISDANGAVWAAMGGQGGAFAFESEPYQLRVLFPLAVGKMLGLPEHEAVALAKRARVMTINVGPDCRVIAVGLSLARSLPMDLAGSLEGEAKVCLSLQDELDAVIIPLRNLDEPSQHDLSTVEGFTRAYCLIESVALDRAMPTAASAATTPRL